MGSGGDRKILLVEVFMAVTVYAGMTLQFSLVAAVGVGLGLSEPEVSILLKFKVDMADLS